MHARAIVDVEVICMRHLHSVSNRDGIHYGNQAELSEHGKEQLKYFAAFLPTLNVSHIVTSAAIRTCELATVEEALGIPVFSSPFYNEWPRPKETINLPNTEPEVERIRTERMQNFGGIYDPQDAVEDYLQTMLLIRKGLQTFRELASNGHRRILHIGHMKRLFQMWVTVLKGGRGPDPDLFRLLHEGAGLGNGDMFKIWYGTSHSGKERWCAELGAANFLPAHLQTS